MLPDMSVPLTATLPADTVTDAEFVPSVASEPNSAPPLTVASPVTVADTGPALPAPEKLPSLERFLSDASVPLITILPEETKPDPESISAYRPERFVASEPSSAPPLTVTAPVVATDTGPALPAP